MTKGALADALATAAALKKSECSKARQVPRLEAPRSERLGEFLPRTGVLVGAVRKENERKHRMWRIPAFNAWCSACVMTRPTSFLALDTLPLCHVRHGLSNTSGSGRCGSVIEETVVGFRLGSNQQMGGPETTMFQGCSAPADSEVQKCIPRKKGTTMKC